MSHVWEPITDLPENWRELENSSLQALAQVWGEQRQRLEESNTFQTFLTRMRRKIAIETGVIERLYTIDRGVTYMLIEHGIDASLIPHGKTDKPASQVVNLVRDNESAIDRVFDFVGQQRELSTAFIKQLHQLLAAHQDTCDAVDQFGNTFQPALIKGDWKKQPNNPQRPDGSIHYYAPPEQVASEMDRLIDLHLEHNRQNISPEVEAAWLHHRFTQIHPFQDGNGRVARNLATLVFLRAGWFPLVIIDDIDQEGEARKRYIDALEQADAGNLKPLVEMFVSAQKQAFVEALSLSHDVLTDQRSVRSVINTAIDKLTKKDAQQLQDNIQRVEQSATRLHELAVSRFTELKVELDEAFESNGIHANVFVNSALPEDTEAVYYYYQIVEAAKLQKYWANLSGNKSWVRLRLRIDTRQTEILLSIHPLGREHTGVMICSAVGWQKALSQSEDEPTTIRKLTILSPETFVFTYKETETQMTQRFNDWLDNVLIIGMGYWQESL